MGDLFTQIWLGSFLHFCEHHSTDFFWSLACVISFSRFDAPCHNIRTKLRSVPLCWTVMTGLPSLFCTANGQCFKSRFTSWSSMPRPINRFTSKIVFWGLEWNAALAVSPTLGLWDVNLAEKIIGSRITYSRSWSVKLTQDGVIRWPWSFGMISTRPPR